MGRLVKNPAVTRPPVALATSMPSGKNIDRPNSPSPGSIRFNEDSNKLESWVFYTDPVSNIQQWGWRPFSIEGFVKITKDTFTGNGTTTSFGPMSFIKSAGDETSVLVFVGNIFQNPGVAYTFNGSSTIQLSSPPPNGHSIVILHGFNSTIAG